MTGSTQGRCLVVTNRVQSCREGSQLSKALAQIKILVLDGVQHGFFEFSISCGIVSGGRREILIRGGKSHKFTIQEDELPH
jgi:hypothetical protein